MMTSRSQPLETPTDDELDRLLALPMKGAVEVWADIAGVPAHRPQAASHALLDRFDNPFVFPEAAAYKAELHAAVAMSTDECVEQLVELCGALSPILRKEGEYASIRPKLIALNLALNERQALAPAFRPTVGLPPRGTKEMARQRDERWILGDRIVLELDWLRVKKCAMPPDNLSHLVSGDSLNVAAASAYANERKSSEKRALELGIPQLERLLLRTIKTPADFDRTNTINAASARARERLINIASDQRRRLDRAQVDRLTAAHIALMIAAGSARVACRIVPHVPHGWAASDASLRDIKKRLRAMSLRVQ